jgi:hypothetical protein
MTEWYGVRCVFRWTEAVEQSYEERITVWHAVDFDSALVLAESEAREYAKDMGATYVGLAQAYATGNKELASGSEVFSLLRDSALPPEEYVDRFFDTGEEHQGTS